MQMSLNKYTTLESAYPVIVEKLEKGGTVTFMPNGTSMLPMLRNGMDIVVLKKPEGKLKKYDLPFYRRNNGSFVLHRIVAVKSDGSYVLCGDNQYKMEEGITDDQIFAVVSAFNRKGKSYTVKSLSYRVYVRFWCYSRPFRRAFAGIKWRAKRLFNES